MLPHSGDPFPLFPQRRYPSVPGSEDIAPLELADVMSNISQFYYYVKAT